MFRNASLTQLLRCAPGIREYVEANGTTKPKAFKLKAVDLALGTSIRVSKRVSVANMTTRRHDPGHH